MPWTKCVALIGAFFYLKNKIQRIQLSKKDSFSFSLKNVLKIIWNYLRKLWDFSTSNIWGKQISNQSFFSSSIVLNRNQLTNFFIECNFKQTRKYSINPTDLTTKTLWNFYENKILHLDCARDQIRVHKILVK